VDILISPLVNMLLLLYGVLGHSFVLAIIVATILIRLITLPLTLPQQRNSRKMAELAPQLEELKKKYGNDRNKFAQAQMELYRENKINMFGGCLPLILQLVIMIAFYQALTGALATNPLQLQTLSHRVLPALVPLIPIDPIFMIYDLGLPGILPAVEQNVSPIVAQLLVFILPALVVLTTYLSQKLMTPPSGDPSQASMTKQMNIIMPMMFGLFALQFASGLSIYFIVSNVVGAAQSWLMNRRWQKQPLLEPGAPAVAASKASKKIAPPADKPAPASKASKKIAAPADKPAPASDNGQSVRSKEKSED
jgi:YidC/Oxa1 family membrane protein insertase